MNPARRCLATAVCNLKVAFDAACQVRIKGRAGGRLIPHPARPTAGRRGGRAHACPWAVSWLSTPPSSPAASALAGRLILGLHNQARRVEPGVVDTHRFYSAPKRLAARLRTTGGDRDSSSEETRAERAEARTPSPTLPFVKGGAILRALASTKPAVARKTRRVRARRLGAHAMQPGLGLMPPASIRRGDN